MKFRRSAWVVLVSAFALVAAACGEDGTPTPGATPGEDGEDPRAVCEADEFGCVEIAEGDPINIGTLLVISGANASLGQDSQNGAVLGADYLDGTFEGTNGQIAGHTVAFNHQDDGCSAEGGQAGGQALASDETIVAVIGTSCSSAALGVADTILSQAGIAIISPSNTGPALTEEGTHQPFYLRTAHNDKLQGAAVAEFARTEQNAESAATIHDGSPYADGLQQVFADEFAAAGGTITLQTAIQVGDTDFTSVLTDVAADSPDVLYFPIFVAEGGLITQQARGTAGLEDTILMGSDGMFTQDWIDAAGADNAEGAFISGPDLTAFTGDVDFYNDEFLPAYEEQFGEEPQSVFHAHSYDAFAMLAAAIEDVAVTDDGTTLIPRTGLRDRLFETSDFPGITGNLTCDELGDCQQTAVMAVVTVENGEFTDPVFTKEYSLD